MIGDKICTCCLCKKDIFLPGNKAGGFWYLKGWKNPNGAILSGGYCSHCVSNKIDHIKPDDTAKNEY